MVRRKKPRRGVVLLVVLSLLSLFVIIALTFVVVAGQYRRAAASQGRQDLHGDNPQRDLDRTMYMLLRDTAARTPLTGHSMLRDLYGEDGVVGQVRNSQSVMDGQLIQIRLQTSPLQPFGNLFRDLDDHYSGCVVTMLDGPAVGWSTRITRYVLNQGMDNEWGTAGVDDNGNDPGDGSMTDEIGEAGYGDDNLFIWVEAPHVDTFRTRGATSVLPGPSNLVLINGRPFNGTGAGYRPVSRNLDQTDGGPGPGRFVSLLPNFGGYESPVNPAMGGTDETYDAADYQNMYLAMVPPAAVRADQIIPSFHRPELVMYWFNWADANYFSPAMVSSNNRKWEIFEMPYGPDNHRDTADDPSELTLAQRDQLVQLKRKFIFRPLSEDHPNFTGSNPDMLANLANGSPAFRLKPFNPDGSWRGWQWDVDNDGDGIPDGIWIDPGFPVKSDAAGRRQKVLVSILIKELDSRLNVNAHSNLAHAAGTYSSAPNNNVEQVQGNFAQNPGAPPVLPLSTLLPRGLGYGPAEINLGAVLQNPTEYSNVLLGRYGQDGQPGFGGADDLLSFFKTPEVPYQFDNVNRPSGYRRTPPDVYGQGALAVDYMGQPITFYMGQLGESVNDPYELNLMDNTSPETATQDTPYTPAELEQILRFHDVDAPSLSGRLASLAPGTFSSSPAARRNRQMVTTESRHIPTPNVVVPRERRTTVAPGASLLDLYRQRLVAGGASNIEDELRKIVPFEFRKGQLLNVNRPFGNGVDDTPAGTFGRGTVDEPRELLLNERAFDPQGKNSVPVPPAQYLSALVNSKNDDHPAFANATSRQMFARHLYCLMLLMQDGYAHPTPNDVESDPNLAKRRELTVRRIAQWAVNVVDFRDSDSIMTGFEYDADPWNGWTVDGNITTTEPGNPDRRVVWGCEHPELMLTETLAFHDRRVKDTDFDSTREKRADGDDDLDQFRIPQGSLFMELYVPRNYLGSSHEPGGIGDMPPAELYDPGTGRLDLARLSPPRASNPTNPMAGNFAYPVWRVALSEQMGPGAAQNKSVNPNRRAGTNQFTTSFEPPDMAIPGMNPTPLSIERVVWFAPLNPNGAGEFEDVTYYNTTGWDASVEPGQYAVVGPRPTTYMGSIDDGIDDITSAWDGNSPQRIVLQNFNRMNPAASGVQVTDVNGAVATPVAGLQTKNAVGIVAATERRNWGGQNPATRYSGVNVTEPLPKSATYYPEPNANNDPINPPDAYADPLLATRLPTDVLPDRPLDERPNHPLSEYSMLGTDTYMDVRAAFLQRLADPTLPWNPERGHAQHDTSLPVNPYITVDWASIDVTVFSGDEDTNQRVDDGDPMTNPDPALDPSDPPNGNPPAARDLALETRQRGYFEQASMAGPNEVVTDNIWYPRTVAPPDRGPQAINPQQVFQHGLRQTFGFLNTKESNRLAGTFSRLNQAEVPPGSGYQGAPRQDPFPWLSWLDRPYQNPLEVLLVPSSSPARLYFEFGNQLSPNFSPPFRSTATMDPYNPTGANDFYAPFAHLFNFFHSTDNTGGSPADGANYFRVLELLETPSPFVGAEMFYNPSEFSDTTSMSGQLAGRHYRPPFNHLSRFRDPGRININMIPQTHWDPGSTNAAGNTGWGVPDVDDDNDGVVDNLTEAGWPGSDDSPRSLIWDGLVRAFPDMRSQAFWNVVRQSRQGYPDPSSNQTINPNYPTQFAQPFRASGAADLAPPIADMRLPQDVDATLLRKDPTNPNKPLFAWTRQTQSDKHLNTNRNAFFKYQGLSRMSNLVTTHSNVYAVWITVGYFEVEPNMQVSPPNPPGINPVVDAAHPDGYRLGQEVGADTGEIRRHRAFYIIDRSIPAAFQPGENHNVDRAILLRRFIE